MASSIRRRTKTKQAIDNQYQEPEHHSVTVRKIDNGFLVSTHKSDKDGFKSNEEYHEKRPKIDIQSIPNVGVKIPNKKVSMSALRTASGNKKVKDT